MKFKSEKIVSGTICILKLRIIAIGPIFLIMRRSQLEM